MINTTSSRRAKTVAEGLLERYPVRNRVWHRMEDGTFISDASQLDAAYGNNWVDPWNRKLPALHKITDPGYDGDTLCWRGVTTVCGEQFKLVIFNT